MVLLSTVGMTVAQDVYSSGYYTLDGIKEAAVYKNSELLYHSHFGSYDNISTSVVVNPSNGDVFWTRSNENYGDVFQNGSIYMSQGTGTYIHRLYWRDHTTQDPQWNLFSAGYKKSDEKKYAAIWRGNNTDPHYSPNYGNGYESEAYDVTTEKTNGTYYVYYCGYEQGAEGGGSPRATVWRGGQVLYNLSDKNSYAYGIDYYDGVVYTVGVEADNQTGLYVTKVWKNASELYVLTNSSYNSRGWDIKVVGGDVWVSGFGTSRALYVWKNGEPYNNFGTGGNVRALDVNSEGVYAAVTHDDQGYIYKNGETLYTLPNCEYLYDVCVGPLECENEEVRTLPYTEGFEMGETDWTCWTVVDEGNNLNDDDLESVSKWERHGEEIVYSGDYCARHKYNTVNAQEGWLISPKIFLQPGRDYSRLTFMSYERYPEDMDYEGVWISTTTNSTSAFTEVWSQTNPSAGWNSVSVNLEDYMGESVYIAFKYAGQDGHSWYIDDIVVSDYWEPCSTIQTLPYVKDFNDGTEPGYCWYVLDNDMSGGVRNWKYSSSEQCLVHPWGQQNTPQEGWVVSTPVELPAGSYYQLTFDEKNSSNGTNMKNSVLIAVDDDLYEISSFSELWSETTNFPINWTTRTIDLSAYAGHTITIAFKYEGTYAHNWYVDNFSITNNLPQYNISVVSNNSSWGSVSGGGTYNLGENVSIIAQANDGYEFLKWTKDGNVVSTEATYNFTATEDATYTAVFGEQSVTYYTITTVASPNEGGIVEGGGTYEEGATATLAAQANMGWQFIQWNDGNIENPRNITVIEDATYTATFSQIQYTINVTAEPAEGGTVTGSGLYNYGQVVEITATANEGYTFLNWNDGETNSVRNITVDGDANYVAYFAQQGATIYTITVLSNNIELGTVSGGGQYPEGSVITISASPIGYATFVNWNDGNTDAIRSITVTANATYTANFSMGTLYTITVMSLNPTMGSVSGGGEFPAGAEITIQANAFGGYHFNGWDDDNFENPRTIIVNGNATYKAKFSEQQTDTYHITVICNANEGTTIGTGDYPAGTTIQIAAIPNAGYRFKEWNDGSTQNPRSITVNANTIYFATFIGDAIDENDSQNISIYPNPANDIIRIYGIEDNSEVRIYNTIGTLMKVVNVSANEEINVGNFDPGLYIIHCDNLKMKFTKE